MSKVMNYSSAYDNDNIEVSALINVLKAHYLVDDSSEYLSIYKTGRLSKTPSTDIYLMPEDKFNGWLRWYYNSLNRQKAPPKQM